MILINSLSWFGAGLVLGSVANAVIYRLPRHMAWWKGSSICPQCRHKLAWYDLIPLLSYLMLGGKCRYCHKSIGWRYLAVELILALGFAYLHSPILATLLFVTVIIAVMDWETQLVSDFMILLWFLVVVASKFSIFNFQFSNSLLGIAIGVGLIGGIWAISKGRAMGFGDVEIAAVLGLWLGWPRVAPALWISFVAGAVVGCWLLVFGKAKMKTKIAFGPFLILGSWIGYLWGERIVSWLF